MKFNWGHGTALFFGSFVVFILFMAFKSFQTDFDLVTEDYYAKELAYQGIIEKKSNEQKLTETVALKRTADGIELRFPADQAANVNGAVQFFRSSDKDLDRLFELSPNTEGVQLFSFSHFSPGSYKVKVDWEANGVAYYKELKIVL